MQEEKELDSLEVTETVLAVENDEPRVCSQCSDSVRTCINCKLAYCFHFASKIDTFYCQYCFHDFVLEDTVLTKEVRSKSLNGKKIFVRNMKARHLVFKGEAWMFAQRRVLEMTDEELIASIEYHREIYSQMLEEREMRSIAKNRSQLRKMIRTSSDKYNPTGLGDSGHEVGQLLGMKSTTVKTTKVTKTRVVTQGGSNPQLAMTALLNILKAKGLTEEQAKSALAGMLKK